MGGNCARGDELAAIEPTCDVPKEMARITAICSLPGLAHAASVVVRPERTAAPGEQYRGAPPLPGRQRL
jgi:hypothetical protein